MKSSTARKKKIQEETRTCRKSEGTRSEMEKVRREQTQVCEKLGKSRNTVCCVSPVFCGSGRTKSRLAKAAGAEVAGQMRHEKLHAVVARSTF